jgi:uncharacterized protein with HEPN domain
MHPKSPKWLQDIADASALIRRATQDKDLAAYEQDAVIRSAIELNFEIIGEALNRTGCGCITIRTQERPCR